MADREPVAGKKRFPFLTVFVVLAGIASRGFGAYVARTAPLDERQLREELLRALVFSLPIKQASDAVPVDEGYALVRVLERKEATREEFEKVKTTERDTLLGEKKNKFLQSYMAMAREEKKVKVNAEAFQRLSQDVLSRYTKTS